MKNLIIVLLSLALSVSLYAQEITGKWTQTHQGSENGSEMTASETLSIAENGTFEEALIMEMKFTDDKDGQQTPVKLKVRISCPGTWSFADKVLSQTYDAKSVKTEVLDKEHSLFRFHSEVVNKDFVVSSRY